MGLGRLTALAFMGIYLLSAETAAAETVYLISGGYVSCRTAWNRPTSTPIFQAARSRLHPDAYVAVCYRTDSSIVSFMSDLGEPQASGNVDDLTQAVRMRMEAAAPNSRLVIIGHSYGASVVLKAALALIREFDVAYIATIDPVSSVSCPPSEFVRSLEGSATAPNPGCTTLPEDLTDRFGELHDASVPWVQFYQDRYAYLHSAPLDAASHNIYLAYPNLSNFWAWRAHALMDSDERVWDVLAHDISLITQP